MGSKRKPTDIFLFWPNIIGGVRLGLLLATLLCMSDYYVAAVSLHLFDVFLDFIDGPIARRYNQCTKFGELFDYLMDKAGNVSFMIKVCQFYPEYTILLQLWTILLYTSSWSHLQASTVIGQKVKSCNKGTNNPIATVYYSEPLFSIQVLGTEFFIMLLYLLHFTEGFLVPVFNIGIVRFLLFVNIPAIVIRVVGNIAQVVGASYRLVNWDAKQRGWIE
uniref:CDP-diacylglycerol--inositol 3-phosphatidyltransferase n=1 Tax=Phallusia mammillata TaxID=59560 RepID=A0A6F9D9F9_9ASCI|nr:CDP-diacylglycerol--inositol 3-phosphatidyltransferase-like [Phallusia mammillata]